VLRLRLLLELRRRKLLFTGQALLQRRGRLL